MAPIPRAITDSCDEPVKGRQHSFCPCFTLQDACFDRPRPGDRIVPLIIAAASSWKTWIRVIATSLSAIVADIRTTLALKLAVTSYLLSLAIFIPASG